MNGWVCFANMQLPAYICFWGNTVVSGDNQPSLKHSENLTKLFSTSGSGPQSSCAQISNNKRNLTVLQLFFQLTLALQHSLSQLFFLSIFTIHCANFLSFSHSVSYFLLLLSEALIWQVILLRTRNECLVLLNLWYLNSLDGGVLIQLNILFD